MLLLRSRAPSIDNLGRMKGRALRAPPFFTRGVNPPKGRKLALFGRGEKSFGDSEGWL